MVEPLVSKLVDLMVLKKADYMDECLVLRLDRTWVVKLEKQTVETMD
jgi:hypothetical protein